MIAFVTILVTPRTTDTNDDVSSQSWKWGLSQEEKVRDKRCPSFYSYGGDAEQNRFLFVNGLIIGRLATARFGTAFVDRRHDLSGFCAAQALVLGRDHGQLLLPPLLRLVQVVTTILFRPITADLDGREKTKVRTHKSSRIT